MNRRSFPVAVGSLLLLNGVGDRRETLASNALDRARRPDATAAADEPVTRFVDVHTHIGQFSNAGQSADGERLTRMLSLAGIEKAICFSAEACYGSIDVGNRYAFSEVRKHEMLYLAVVVHPYHYDSSVRLLRELGDHPKLVAVKIHPHMGNYHISSAELARLMEEEIAPRGLPVLSHVANDAPNVSITDFLLFARKYPSVRFVAAHLGMGVLGDPHSVITAWLESKPSNVWLDLATLRFFYTGALLDVLRVVGAERICFGTDAPLYWPPAFTRSLKTLNLAAKDVELIAWKNAKHVFSRMPI